MNEKMKILILVVAAAAASLLISGMLFNRKLEQVERQFEAERQMIARAAQAATEQESQIVDRRNLETAEGGVWKEAEGSPAVYEGIKYIYSGRTVGLVSGKIWLDEMTGVAWSAPSTEPMDNRMEVKEGKVTGTGAVGFCETLSKAAYGGRRNWKLPTQTQLMVAYVNGATGRLTEQPRYFWSATEFFGDNTRAWRVNLAAGDVTSAPKADKVNSYGICVAGS